MFAVRSVVALFVLFVLTSFLSFIGEKTDPAAEAVTLFRLYNGNDHLYTTSETQRDSMLGDYYLEPNAARVFTSHKAGTVPLFRLYSAAKGDHIYTTSDKERTALIASGQCDSQEHAGFVYTSQAPGTVPFYRLHRPVPFDHFYTTDDFEMASAVDTYNYTLEGISCYVYKA
ncbi:hypothetical protein FIBSPDRAFT_874956 [Athelia psychrophila]|uniref:DUF5648 domain-containing protein n=1 Tax=Athelia psychrophila TaxID=1759441 RepID=A0A165WVS3_9AGAM|nr:hypothetical protein FIBSPDRAFT_874956 [Fibularhizoctonia sp. CBS 109695]